MVTTNQKYKKEKEYILCAAIHYDGEFNFVHQPKNISTGYVMCGRRHHNIINLRFDLLKEKTAFNSMQGFLTSLDRFVDRYDAALIAFDAGQTETQLTTLYSEDLY